VSDDGDVVARLCHLFEELDMNKTWIAGLSAAGMVGLAGVAQAQAIYPPAPVQAVPVAPAAQDYARVISSTPITEQVWVPQQVCEPVAQAVPGATTGGGAAIGAVIGGVLGNMIGHGGGRAAATAIGAIGGAAIGNNAEASTYPQVAQGQACRTVEQMEMRTTGYNVVYEYGGRQYSAVLPQDPGPQMAVQVNPVGAVGNQPYAASGMPSVGNGFPPGPMGPVGSPAYPVYTTPYPPPVAVAPPVYYPATAPVVVPSPVYFGVGLGLGALIASRPWGWGGRPHASYGRRWR